MSEEFRHPPKSGCCPLYLVNNVLYVNIVKDHMVIMQFTILSVFKFYEL